MTYRAGKRFFIEYYEDIGGRRIRRRKATTATTMKQAQALEDEMKVREERRRLGLEARNRNPGRMTIRALVEWHLERIKDTPSVREVRYSLRAHVTEVFADMQLENVDTAVVSNWLDRVQEKRSLQGPTMNRIRAYLMSAFTKATKAGLFIGENPVKGTRRRDEEQKVRRALPASSILPLLAAAPTSAWRAAFALAAYAGLRRGEIRRLVWSDVDLAEGVLYIRGTKAKRDRVVPIHEDLARILERVNEAATQPS